MRVLLDEQLPRQLAHELTSHDAVTVQQQGWSGATNGELLRLAAASGFEALITADQNLEFQHDLTGSDLRVVVLVASSNALEDLTPLIPRLLTALSSSGPGRVVRIAA